MTDETIECKHNWEEIKKENPEMLFGFDYHEKCLICGVQRFHVKCQIKKLIKMLAQHKKMKIKDITPKILLESGYFDGLKDEEQAKYLIDNQEKYI